jgi:hypothetical protein
MGCILSKPQAKIAPKASKYQTTTITNTKANDNAKAKANPNANKVVKMKSFQSKKVQPNKPKATRKVDHSDSDWAIYLDELRNPYFFNVITGNSEWIIPSEISTWPEFANAGYVTAIVTIPSDAIPGTIYIIALK